MIILIVLHYVLIHRNFIQLQTQCVTHPDYPIIQLFVFESYRNDIDSSAFRILGKRKSGGIVRKAKKQKKADMVSTPANGKKMKTPSILSLFKKRNKKPVPLSPASAMKDLSLD